MDAITTTVSWCSGYHETSGLGFVEAGRGSPRLPFRKVLAIAFSERNWQIKIFKARIVI